MQARARRAARPFNLDAYMLYGGDTLGDVTSVSAAVLRQVQTKLNQIATEAAKTPNGPWALGVLTSLPLLVVDGKMGPKTAARLKEYQSGQGLPVSGVADTATRNRLLGSVSPVVTGPVSTDYYVKGTKFMWLIPAVNDYPGETARAKLAASLRAASYVVNVVYSDGNALEVSGSQSIDRASANDIRNQITQAAQAAGFSWTMPVQFNVERAGSPFRVGNVGSQTTWGDKTPAIITPLPTELGLNPFGKGLASVNLPSLSGSYSTIAIIIVAALLVGKFIKGK